MRIPVTQYNPADMLAVGERDVMDLWAMCMTVDHQCRLMLFKAINHTFRCYVHDTAAFLLLTFVTALADLLGYFHAAGKRQVQKYPL